LRKGRSSPAIALAGLTVRSSDAARKRRKKTDPGTIPWVGQPSSTRGLTTRMRRTFDYIR
jgi:hypothetical protein